MTRQKDRRIPRRVVPHRVREPPVAVDDEIARRRVVPVDIDRNFDAILLRKVRVARPRFLVVARRVTISFNLGTTPRDIEILGIDEEIESSAQIGGECAVLSAPFVAEFFVGSRFSTSRVGIRFRESQFSRRVPRFRFKDAVKERLGDRRAARRDA